MCIERVRSAKDGMFLLNTDVIVEAGSEGLLVDLSDLPAAQNLRDVVRMANTIDGKLVAIPQEVVAYGLYVNADILQAAQLDLPTPPKSSWNTAARSRPTATTRPSVRTAGGLRRSCSPRPMPTCTTGETSMRR